MENDLILEINNVGPISHAKINIGKISIIGGKNSTGKSTSSKLLYCFLRANSPDSEQLIINNTVILMDSILKHFNSFFFRRNRLLRNRLAHGDINDVGDIEEDIFSKEDYEKLRKMQFVVIDDLGSYISPEELIRYADYLNDFYEKLSENFDENDRRLIFIKRKLDTFNDTVFNILPNPERLFKSILQELIFSEFGIEEPSNFGGDSTFKSTNIDVKDSIDFAIYDFHHENSFPIEQIYYLDSFSIFDKNFEGITSTDHVKVLIDSLVAPEGFKAGIHDDLREKNHRIKKGINQLINGEMIYKESHFEYVSNEGVISQIKNTASGIKQIAAIQMLIKGYKLYPGSFLIIDEPEVNLHPEWQVKFAGILMLLVKHLDISLYINTHSPIFIEAMNAYAEYHDLLDETNYYMTEESEEKGKFNIAPIANDELYTIYNDLGSPYDLINEVRVRTTYKDIE